MISVDVRADFAMAKRHLHDLAQNRINAATVRALNKAAVNVRTEAVKVVRSVRALPARTVRDAFKIRKASKYKLISTVEATGRPIPLRDYGARRTARGATVKVTKGGARTRVQHKGNTAFIVEKIGGHVFAREGDKRLPIKKLYGPSVPTALTKQATMQALGTVGRRAFTARFTEEIRFEIRRAGLGGG